MAEYYVKERRFNGSDYDTLYPTVTPTDGMVKTANGKSAVAQAGTDYVAPSTTVNNKPLSSNVTLVASDVGAVPISRTVNSKALSSDIVLTAADVGALPISGGKLTGSDIYRSVDNSHLFLTGASTWRSGAMIYLYGKDSAQSGRFTISACSDGTNEVQLNGYTSGKLSWTGVNYELSLRNSALVSSESNPTQNGTIHWTYA